jgi:hypothetical protein
MLKFTFFSKIIMNIPPARVYEWEKGTAMRFDTMIELLSVVGVELVIKK